MVANELKSNAIFALVLYYEVSSNATVRISSSRCRVTLDQRLNRVLWAHCANVIAEAAAASVLIGRHRLIGMSTNKTRQGQNPRYVVFAACMDMYRVVMDTPM